MASLQLSRAAVQKFDLFRSLSDDDLDAVLRDATSTLLKENEAVFRQGDAADRFFVLLQGRLKVSQTTPDGEQVIVRYVNPGDVFGIARAVGRSHFPASTVAVQESLILTWPSTAWDSLVATSPQFASRAIQTVGQRLQDAHSRIRELSTEEVEQRVARALVRLVKQSGEQTDEGMQINFPITRQDIAEMTGSTLHTVSRLLSAWAGQGIIRSGRRRITVSAPERLLEIAESGPPEQAPRP